MSFLNKISESDPSTLIIGFVICVGIISSSIVSIFKSKEDVKIETVNTTTESKSTVIKSDNQEIIISGSDYTVEVNENGN